MPWSKLDDGLHENAKIGAMSDKAFRLWVYSITYCSRHYLGAHALPAVAAGGARAYRAARPAAGA